MSGVTFIVADTGSREDLEHVAVELGRINGREVNSVVVTANRDEEFDSATIARINEALEKCSQNLVMIIRSDRAKLMDWAGLPEKFERLDSRPDASCLFPVSGQLNAVSRDYPADISGPAFLYECFRRGVFPRLFFEQVIFRGLTDLEITAQKDQFILLQQLVNSARRGDFLLDLSMEQTELQINAETLVGWMHFIHHNSSFLRCFGWIRKDLMLLLNSAIEGAVSQKSNLEELIKQFQNWLPENLEPPAGIEANLLLASLLQLFPLQVEESSRKSSLFVLRRRILQKEFRLRRLLSSRSWRYTAWLREINRDVMTVFFKDSQIVLFDDSSLDGYDQYLGSEISKILRSRSWKITAPFRGRQAEEAQASVDA